MKTLIVILASLLLLSSQSIAAYRITKCQIESNGEATYKGTCLFLPDTKGSFSLENPIKNKPLTNDVIMVSVTLVEKGIAEVQGLTVDGINSRWGEAKRSLKDKACWEGDDFKVCAW